MLRMVYLKGIRDDEIAAEAMGVNLFKTKQLSFVVSSAFAGVAGGLLAVFMRSVQLPAHLQLRLPIIFCSWLFSAASDRCQDLLSEHLL